LLVVDEYYFEYYGITAFPLLSVVPNLVILRSFTASFSISSSDTGYVIASPEMIDRLKHAHRPKRLSLTVRKTILASLLNEEAMTTRLKEIHDESLRIAMALSGLGVQSRICATDYLLFRVADTAAVCNHLTRAQIPIDSLESYPELDNYLRYRIQSEISNDRLLEVFGKMNEADYRLTDLDRRGLQLRSRAAGPPRRATRNRIKDLNSTKPAETDPRKKEREEPELETVG
jgi:histidinol-phosphate aminotransferase